MCFGVPELTKLLETFSSVDSPLAACAVITKYDVTHHSMDIKNNFDELEGQVASIAGRMMLKRVMGKASFCNVQDKEGNIQVYVARDEIGEES